MTYLTQSKKSGKSESKATRQPVLDAALEKQLEKLLHGLVSRKGIHHAVIAIESMDKSFRWVGTAGEAHPDGKPMRPDIPYFIASVTKLYIAATILRLHEQGEVNIEEPMSAYLPSSMVNGLHRIDGTDHTAQITVRHLLSHASGLPDFLEERPIGGKALFDLLLEEGDRSWTIEEAMDLVREDLTPYFPPQPLDEDRQKIRYSDTNFQLLIAIIEAVTGKQLSEAFEEHLYQPLGLQRTFHPGTDPREPTPEPATVWAGEEALDIPKAMRSFGDLYSTVDDQLAFMRALVEGTVFDNPATGQLMQERWNRFGFSLSLRPLSPGWPIEYGLGMMRFHIPRIFSPLSPTPEVIGHTGATSPWLFYCPELDLLLAGTVDQATAAAVPFRFVPRLLRVLARAAG